MRDGASNPGAVLDLARAASSAYARAFNAATAALARGGYVTGASQRNARSFDGEIVFDAGVDAIAQAILFDPQTSGGLLVACAPDAADDVLRTFHAAGFAAAAVIGEMAEGAGVTVA